MANPERLSKTAERIVEDFCWAQWDGHAQRLYYLTLKVAAYKSAEQGRAFVFAHTDVAVDDGVNATRGKCLSQDKFLLRCVQFHSNRNFETAVSQLNVILEGFLW